MKRRFNYNSSQETFSSKNSIREALLAQVGAEETFIG